MTFLPLNRQNILSHLKDSKIALEIFDTIDSTNNYLKFLEDTDQVTVCLAEEQLKGRGQFNRAWHSPHGQNIYCSIRYPLSKDCSGLSLAIGLALIDALKNFSFAKDLKLKWPNDLYYQEKKLAGILVELLPDKTVVIGVGLNVNMDLDQSIKTPWVSIAQILQKTIDRNDLVVKLIGEILLTLDLFSKEGFLAFCDRWQQSDLLFNQNIDLKIAEGIISGIEKGVDSNGRLILETAQGLLQSFHSAEIIAF